MSDTEGTVIYIGTFEVHLNREMNARRRAYNAKLCLATLGHATEFDLSMDPECKTKLSNSVREMSARQAFGACKGQLVADYNRMKQMKGSTTRLEVACVQNSYVMLGWLSMFGHGTRFEIVAGSAVHVSGRRVPHCWLQDSQTGHVYDVASNFYSEHIPMITQGDEKWEVMLSELMNRDIRTVSPLRAWLEAAAAGQSPILGYAKLKEHVATFDYYLDQMIGGSRNATKNDDQNQL